MSTAREVRTERICLLDDTVKHTNRWERRAAGTCSRGACVPATDKALMGASLSLCVAAARALHGDWVSPASGVSPSSPLWKT
jgi:hypothetical protein